MKIWACRGLDFTVPEDKKTCEDKEASVDKRMARIAKYRASRVVKKREAAAKKAAAKKAAAKKAAEEAKKAAEEAKKAAEEDKTPEEADSADDDVINDGKYDHMSEEDAFAL